MPKLEHLSQVQEIRAENSDEGIIEGYVAVWDTVDSYNSRFQKGAFTRTLKNRMNKIKVLWNHDTEQPIGKLTDIREDDHGVFIRAQLIMEVDKAKETLALIKGEAIDCFSFGFRTIKDKYENGIQVITEVMLGEISPVVFEANPASKITSARSEEEENPKEERNSDFDMTLEENAMRQGGNKLMQALYETLEDIWWNESDENIPNLVSKAVGSFASSYSSWANDIVSMRSDEKRMSVETTNELSDAFYDFCNEQDKTIEQIAQETTFTIDELKSLRNGRVVPDFGKLDTLSDELLAVHEKVRSKAVEELCNELRNGINSAEATRIYALLKKSLHASESTETEPDKIASYMSDFRNKLNGDK